MRGQLGGVGVFSRRTSGTSSTRRSVSSSWISSLPRDKNRVFDSVVARWESSYAMMSIALQDALTFRSCGQLVCARQQVGVASELWSCVSRLLVFACETLSASGRHVSDIPHVEPLKTEFFRGDTAQSAASWNGILHHVLFAERSRFFHKLRILSGTLERLETEFSETAADIADGLTTDPNRTWCKLDSLHYDFNTCLRETEIVFKSLLHALPSEHLPALAAELEKMPVAKPKPVRVRPRAYRISA